jgi:hypothetical protein
MVHKQPFLPGHRDDLNRFEREWGESKEILRIASCGDE